MYAPIKKGVEERALQDVREELARLEAREAIVSGQRRYLHNQIDLGYATPSTRGREREVSDERRQLHHRIDALRKFLSAREVA